MHETKKREPNPCQESIETLIERMAKAFFVRERYTGQPLPCISGYHLNGLAVPIYSAKTDAEALRDQLADAYREEAEVAPIAGLWNFLRECAASGCEGAILDDQYPVKFFNRISDRDRTWPSLMQLCMPQTESPNVAVHFGRFGSVNLSAGSAVPWVDYERFDRTSNRYVLRGNPLPEPIEAHAILSTDGADLLFPNGATFLGPYVSDVGAVAVFSKKSWATHFAWHNGLIASFNDDAPQLREGFQIASVPLSHLLEAVHQRHGPFVDIGLNPECHRFRQGWFFAHSGGWALQTISGTWSLSGQGSLTRSDMPVYKGYLGSIPTMSIAEQAQSSVVRDPFKRVLGSDGASLTEEDAKLVLDQELANAAEPMLFEDGQSLPTDAFLIDAFDKVSGERYGFTIYGDDGPTIGFLAFPDVIAATAFLIHDILSFDEQIRTNGFQLCHGGGRPGSGNSERERQVTSSCIEALRKNLLDALVGGYTPQHALQIKRLMQDVTETFEVTEIGYFGDLVFYGTADGGAIEERLDPEEELEYRAIEKVRRLRERISTQVTLPAEIESRLKSALGQTYEDLAPESRVIASSALEELQRTGKRAGYDYAGISMKVSKIVERELLSRLFKPWRQAVRAEPGVSAIGAPPEDEDHVTSLRLLDWLKKRSKLDLGAIRFALRAARRARIGHEPLGLLAAYLAELTDGPWLASSDFEAALVDISTKYRNGGVHEHMVTYEICHEAMESLLLGDDPLIVRLVVATTHKAYA